MSTAAKSYRRRSFLIAARLLSIPITVFALLALTSAQKQPRLAAEQILDAERRLAELGFWTGPVDGILDGASRHAVVAFQKTERHPLTGTLTVQEFESIKTAKAIRPRESGYPHVEVDLMRQILFIVDSENRATKILPISSGSGRLFTSEGWTRRAITPAGKFSVYRKVNGRHRSALGLLYYPVFIVSGVAIHGNPSVPSYPASHGCIRIPMFAAAEFSKLVPIGTVVLVYDEREDLDTP